MEWLQERWNECFGILKSDEGGDDTDANRIKSAEIVFVFGASGAGKTFSGDYLDIVHGYHHVDGDIPLKNIAVVPEYMEMVENWLVDGDWAPHFSELARLTLEAAEKHDRVVLSHASYTNETRDHVVKKLIEGGVSEDRITLIQLMIDPEVQARGLFHRYKVGAEKAGLSLSDACRARGWEFEGEMTEELFVKFVIKGMKKDEDMEQKLAIHPDATVIDVSERNDSQFDNIDKALGLTRSKDWSYESFCVKAKAIEDARDKEMIDNGSGEAFHVGMKSKIAAKKEEANL